MFRTLKKDHVIPSKKEFYSRLEPIDIPSYWKKLLYDRIVEDTISAGNFERYRAVFRAWKWIDNKNDTFWIIIDTLDYLGAASVKMILDSIIDDYDIDDSDPKVIASMDRTIRRAIKRLYKCRVIEAERLGEDELGHNRYAVTLYISPFHTTEQLKRTRSLYMNMGGFGVKKKKKEPKSNKYVVDHNLERGDMFERGRYLRKVRKDAKLGIFHYVCPECEASITHNKHAGHFANIVGDRIVDKCNRCGHPYLEKVIPEKTGK